MKFFLTFFVLCFLLGGIILFFFGSIFFNNFWIILTAISAVIAVILAFCVNLTIKIDELTEMMKELLAKTQDSDKDEM